MAGIHYTHPGQVAAYIGRLVVIVAFVPGHSGGPVPDSRGVPYPEKPIANGEGCHLPILLILKAAL